METIPLFGPYALRRLRTEDAPDIFASIDTQRRYLGPVSYTHLTLPTIA